MTDNIMTLADQPHQSYLDAPGISSGMLRLCHEKTPKHVWAAYIDPNREMEETPAMLAGRALHTRFLLGPGPFAEEFAVAPECDRRTKAGKEIWADFTETNAGKHILKEDEAERIILMAGALESNKEIMALMEGAQCELSVFAGDRKCRFDLLTKDGFPCDVKTTSDISRHAVARDIAKYGYHIQAAWYLRLAEEAGYPQDKMEFPLLFVENKPPFDTAIRVISPDAIARGKHIIDRVYPVLQHCLEANDWPGFADEGAEYVELPLYAMTDD